LNQSREVAESLLQFMRDPSSVVERVQDVCEVDVGVVVRRIDLWIRPDALELHDGYAYIDVFHFEKGVFIDWDLLESSDASRVSHHDHQSVGEFLIQTRFVSLWASAKVEDQNQEAFDREMYLAQEQLSRIPYENAVDAERLLWELFDRKTALLKVVDKHEAAVKPGLLRGLFMLCKRLVWRYLALVRVKVSDGLVPSLSLKFRQQLTQMDLDDGGSWVARLWKPVHRVLTLGQTPSSFRIHLPWAKRSEHYTFTIAAAQGHFISRQWLLRGTLNKANGGQRNPGKLTRVRVDDRDFKWSINTNQGQQTSLFITDATDYRFPIYLGIQNLELPGGSTSSALTLAWFVSLAMFCFGLLEVSTSGFGAIQAGWLVLALLAIGAFSSSPPRGNGVLGFPLASRIVPKLMSFLLILFIFWSVARGLEPSGLLLSIRPLAEFVSKVAAPVGDWGFAFPVAASIFVSYLLSVRASRLRKNFARVNATAYVVSNNFR
jgi:hypothetical protein